MNHAMFVGFIMGAIFAYSGFITYFAGCLTGVLVCHQYSEEMEHYKPIITEFLKRRIAN
jgi:hypothetical protein